LSQLAATRVATVVVVATARSTRTVISSIMTSLTSDPTFVIVDISRARDGHADEVR
jgi:hypothetical protein